MKFASEIILESNLPYNFPIEQIPEIVDGVIWIDNLKISSEEREKVISKVVELLPEKGWDK
jgi:hypothetical protein